MNAKKYCSSPMQLVPFPVYPLLQVQTKDPAVFAQAAFTSHGFSTHSLISAAGTKNFIEKC